MWWSRQAEQERWATSTGAIGSFRDFTDSSQLRWCSLLSGRWISVGPMTDLMILGSLAWSAVVSFSFATGSLAVTFSFPRETKIHPLVPMHLMPLGKSPLTIMCTTFA